MRGRKSPYVAALTIVLCVAACPEPGNSGAFHNAESAIATADAHRPDVFLCINALQQVTGINNEQDNCYPRPPQATSISRACSISLGCIGRTSLDSSVTTAKVSTFPVTNSTSKATLLL
jgi:hypothetical protein